MTPTLEKALLDILVCPACKGELSTTPEKDGLICEPCQIVFPIKDGIPVMLMDEAVSIENWQR